MKKSFIAALLISSLVFTACGGSSKSGETTNEENKTEVTIEDVVTDTENTVKDKVEEVKGTVEETKGNAEAAVETVKTAGSEILSKYETLVNEILPLAEKVKKGDIKAIADYTKKSKALSDFVEKNATALTGLTGDDAKKYKELADSLISSFKK